MIWQLRVKGMVSGSTWELTALKLGDVEYTFDPAKDRQLVDVRIDLGPGPAYAEATVREYQHLTTLKLQPGDTLSVT